MEDTNMRKILFGLLILFSFAISARAKECGTFPLRLTFNDTQLGIQYSADYQIKVNISNGEPTV